MAALPAPALARVVDFVLHGLPPATNPSIRILDYGDEAVFRDLWLKGLELLAPTIKGEDFDWNQSDRQILIETG